MDKKKPVSADEELIDLYFARDEEALRLTKERFGKLIRALCRNILGSDEDAEECESDVLWHLWNSIPPARPDNFRAFASSVARNRALDVYEKRARQKRVPAALTEALDDWADALFDKSAEETFDDKQLSRALNSFLSGLDAPSRRVFVWRFYFAKPIREIARLTAKSERAVYEGLSATKKKLRAFLIKEGYTL